MGLLLMMMRMIQKKIGMVIYLHVTHLSPLFPLPPLPPHSIHSRHSPLSSSHPSHYDQEAVCVCDHLQRTHTHTLPHTPTTPRPFYDATWVCGQRFIS